MPRPRRLHAPKDPPKPVVYEESGVVAEVAHRLIRLFPAAFGWTANFRIGYVMVSGARRKADREFDHMAKFRKVPPLYHGLTDFDAVVEVKDVYWHELNAEQQEALVAHELCHGAMSDKGALRVVPHDLTEFRFVVRHWGAWQPDIDAFHEQLELFDATGAPARAVQGDQIAMTDATPELAEVKPDPTIAADKIPPPRQRMRILKSDQPGAPA